MLPQRRCWISGDQGSTFTFMRESDRKEAADLLRRLLGLVGAGELSADGRAGAALTRRLEGALLAIDAILSHPRSLEVPGR